jgi:antitoxin component of MazEF toxin-antitoxin module
MFSGDYKMKIRSIQKSKKGSHTVCIPPEDARRAGLDQGTLVHVEEQNGMIIVTPVTFRQERDEGNEDVRIPNGGTPHE